MAAFTISNIRRCSKSPRGDFALWKLPT